MAFRLCPLLLGCFMAGFVFAAPLSAESRKPTHIACVGDSITAGSGASDPSKNYVSQLQALVGNAVQVKNFGHSAATMLGPTYGDLPYVQQPEYAAATTFVSDAGANAVVSVIIILGANDSKPFNWEPQGKPKNDQQYKTDYLAMVDHFLNLPTKPTVYVGLPLSTGNNPCCSIRGDVIHDQEIPLIKEVAMMKHVPIIDLNTDTANHPEYFGDGVHPNDGGYVVMANLVKKGLDREPSVSISSPGAADMPSAGMVPVTAMASGGTVDISNVEFFDGASSLGKVMAAPFTLNWQATAGAHQLTAKATDTTLANATSAALDITVKEAMSGGAGGGNGSAGTAGTSSLGGGGTAGGGAASGGASTAGMSGAASGSAGMLVGGAGGSGVSNPTPTNTADSGGCGCALSGSPRPTSVSLLLLAASLGALRRRRRA
ncbi:MAG TPA: GDSL-type esterase/lipase family protein [Polyangiaceae bacterium]|nr:GDSL-type esterase/lipase family protein [Polyangiaceae bacterium]